jgi:hypothetical protein
LVVVAVLASTAFANAESSVFARPYSANSVFFR